ncbi:hypothetical protein BGZ76_007665 [Entomortierella beljakovae]|nr:hypothetical protein BGZ76_007665 [Entomortierella beljakovae]
MTDESKKKIENPEYFTLNTDEGIFVKTGDAINNPISQEEIDDEDGRSEITIPSYDGSQQRHQFCDFRVNDNGSNKGNVLMATVFLLEKAQLVREYCLLHSNYVPDLSRIGKEFAMFSIELEERDQRFAGTIARDLYSFYYTLIREYLDVVKTFDTLSMSETEAYWKDTHFFQYTSELYDVNEELAMIFSERKGMDEFDQLLQFHHTPINNTSFLTSPLYPYTHSSPFPQASPHQLQNAILPSIHDIQSTHYGQDPFITDSSLLLPLTFENLSLHVQQLEMKGAPEQKKSVPVASRTSSKSSTSTGLDSNPPYDITFGSLMNNNQSIVSASSERSLSLPPNIFTKPKAFAKPWPKRYNQDFKPIKPDAAVGHGSSPCLPVDTDPALNDHHQPNDTQSSELISPATSGPSLCPVVITDTALVSSQHKTNLQDSETTKPCTDADTSHHGVMAGSVLAIDPDFVHPRKTTQSPDPEPILETTDPPSAVKTDSASLSPQHNIKDSETIRSSTEMGVATTSSNHATLGTKSVKGNARKSSRSVSIKSSGIMLRSSSLYPNKAIDSETVAKPQCNISDHDSEPIGRRTRGRHFTQKLPLSERMNNLSKTVKKKNEGEKQRSTAFRHASTSQIGTKGVKETVDDEENQKPVNFRHPERVGKQRGKRGSNKDGR